MHTEDFQIRLGEKLQRKAIAKLSYWNIDGKCLSINDACRTWYGDLLQTGMLPEVVVPNQNIATEYLHQALQDATVT